MSAVVVPAAEQTTVGWRDGGTYSRVLPAEATCGQLGMGRFRAQRGDATAFHMHTREDEVFLLLAGTALVWCGDQELELAEGGAVYLPRNVPHGYRITSAHADLLMVCTPGGFESMFLQAGVPYGHAGVPDPDAMRAAAEEFGQVIVGPPR